MGKVTLVTKRREPGESIAGLFSDHDAELKKFLTRMLGSSAEAADVAQDTYLKLYRHWRPKHAGYSGALLRKVAANLAIDRIKRLKRQQQANVAELEAAVERVAYDEPLPEMHLAADETIRWLDRVIERLPPQRRRVLLLCKVMGMTVSEAAREMGITASTAEQHLAGAIAYCKQRWTQRENH